MYYNSPVKLYGLENISANKDPFAVLSLGSGIRSYINHPVAMYFV